MSGDIHVIGVLTRLEICRLRAFIRVAARDITFDLCVLVLLGIGYAAVRAAFHSLVAAPSWARLVIAYGVGVVLVFGAYGGAGSRDRARLLAGPFHALVREPRQMTLWLTIRALALSFGLILGVALAFASLDPVAAGVFLITAGAGAGSGGAVAWIPRPGARRLAAGGVASSRVGRRSPWAFGHPALIIAMATLRRGPVSPGFVAAALLILGAGVGRMAARASPAPEIGYPIAAIAAVLAGATLFPRGKLPGLLGREPVGLLRVFAWLYAAPLTTALLGGAAAGLAAGSGWVAGIEAAVAAATALGIVALFAFLHRMIRSERGAPLSTALEFAAALTMAAVETSLGPVWLLARGLILARAARRRRWLDR